MNILMLDISGKVTKYTLWVSNAISKGIGENDTITVYTPLYRYDESTYANLLKHMKYTKLLNLVPRKYKQSFSIVKRLIKSIEVLVNYMYILAVISVKKIDVVHSQFLPFADFINIEYYILKILKYISPKTKLVLTIHDVLPHDLLPENTDAYCRRYAKVASVFDAYMVHTYSCKQDVINYLSLPEDKIHVSYHPIFISNHVTPVENIVDFNGTLKMIMFGLQTPYKGTDILVDALNRLPQEYKCKFEVTIAGTISDNYLATLKARSGNANIIWIPYYLSEKELDEKINESNIIILPYRSISQSGVLLLSLFFKKLIITSNLPSFVESLEGYEPDWFFESENPDALAKLLMNIVDRQIDICKQQSVINQLCDKYSLQNFTNKTLEVYNLWNIR